MIRTFVAEPRVWPTVPALRKCPWTRGSERPFSYSGCESVGLKGTGHIVHAEGFGAQSPANPQNQDQDIKAQK